MRHDESLLAYSVRMQELAVQGGIENSSLIINTILLYGATSMQEFKRKLNRVYKTQAATAPAIGQYPN